MRKKAVKISIALTLLLLICLSAASVCAAVTTIAGPEQIVLSLTQDPTEMAATWCDAEGTSDAGITYSLNSDLSSPQTVLAEPTASGSGYQYFEATMTGLASGKTYYYKVGTSGNMSSVNSFKTSGAGSGYQFMYLGDVQYNTGTMVTDYNSWKNLVESAYAANPGTAFILQGGDMVNYGQDPAEWQAFLQRAQSVFAKVPVMTVPGNHESNATSGKPEMYLGIFDMPKNGPSGFEEEFYSFDYGNSHIVCLDSNILSDEQLNAGTMAASDFDKIKNWIAHDLSSSTKKWKIVVMHHPAYIDAQDDVSEKVLNEWAPIFEDGGVSLVLCGHQHVYMRTYPMFDRERNDASGITYIMGNSGSKFYDAYDVGYDASLIADVSNYQIVNVADGGLTVATYDAAGAVRDTTTITEPAIEARNITLNYSASTATVTAPAVSAAGNTVTVGVSNITSGKKVYKVTVTDKNNKTYAVTTVTANSSYSFTMPNRSVTIDVAFEDSTSGTSGDTATYYSYTIDNGGDPIWTIDVVSSGISADDSSKISAGSTVTVTVTRASDALGASLDGVSVKKGSETVSTTTVSTTKGTNSTVKAGKYQFIMPAGSVKISPSASYLPLAVYAREGSSDKYVLENSFDRSTMLSFAKTNAYYTGYDSYPTDVIGKANQYVTLKTLLKKSGIELTEGSTITLTSLDGGTWNFTYDQLYGSNRYYYPNLDAGSASGKVLVEPMLVIKGYQSRFMNLASGKTIDDMAPDTLAAYRFAFGQTEEDFNDGSPSSKCVTVSQFVKWTNSIKITGYKPVSEDSTASPSGGSAVVSQTAAAVDAAGKATATLDTETIKSNLKEAIAAGKGSGVIPEIKFEVKATADTETKSVEVTLPQSALKELTAVDSLLVTISTPIGDTTLDSAALKAIQAANPGKDIKLSINNVTAGNVSITDGRELTGSIVDITVMAGVQSVTDFGSGKIKIQIPFTPNAAQKIKGYYVVWLTAEGKSVRMQGSCYDAEEGTMQFETRHLSRYAVAYTDDTAVNIYNDIDEDAWYTKYVTFVTENGFLQGTAAATFSPDSVMTRAMFVTALGRANNVSAAGYTKTSFSDSSISDWYGCYVQWAYENGIVSGIGGDKFAPNQAITREQLTTILKNYYRWKGGQTEEASNKPLTYTDKNQLSAWAISGVQFCASKGWISGYPDGSFKPGKTATRAETARILNSILNDFPVNKT